ncbi:uncharacterized protein LOC114967902 isoform X2 [Acropora millepora]|nr:uncharacterized protein LOC114967902 isoform X2 [Acropora millepora]
MWNTTVTIYTILCTTTLTTHALFLSWDKNANLTEDDIFISRRKFYIPGKKHDKVISELKNLTSYSLDERCEKGKPLSVSWSVNEPYSSVMGPNIGNRFGFVARGIFPTVVQRIVRHCCNGSQIVYGMLLRSNREPEDHFSGQMYDLTFPVYESKMDKDLYRDQPFVKVVSAPRVMLLVYDGPKQTRTQSLVNTIFYAWPFLIFILVAAASSGLSVWLLESLFFSKEFSGEFYHGVWDGFWWAFVTMTTVGYGDRSPKSIPGRIFCFFWIITGINIIAIFTALVTATVTATTQPHFNVHGAKIGAVNGSEEFRLGVSLNFDMQAFGTPAKITRAVKNKEVEGVLIDNYALTRFSNLMEDDPIRLERTIEHPITYGLVLPTGSPRTAQCVRRYMDNYNHEIFEHIAKHLKPVKSSNSEKDYAVKEVEGLFYQESLFNRVITIGGGVVGSLMFIGLVWEFSYWRKKHAGKDTCPLVRCNANAQLKEQHDDNETTTELTTIKPKKNLNLNPVEKQKEELIQNYNRFHKRWMDELMGTKLR